MSFVSAMASREAAKQDGGSTAYFNSLLVPRQGSVAKALTQQFILVVGPDVDGEPVLTLMLPGED